MYVVTDPMSAKSRGSVDAAVDFAGAENADRLNDVEEFLHALWTCAEDCELDYALLVAQSAHETANWSSQWWIERLNPAGIGITGDPAQNEASGTWANGTEAARAQTVHMCAYTYGAVPDDYVQYIPLDPRWDAVFEAGYDGFVEVVADLGNGVWATDPDYAQEIADRANVIFGEETSMPDIQFGHVPYPPIVPSYLPASNPYVVESGAPEIPDAVMWHRMIGSWSGTNSWFWQGMAATMYGVAVEQMDGASKAGLIYEWIKPKTGWYGESSGPANAPYGDGLIYVNDVGAGSVNRRSVAIEISGYETTPLDEKSRASIAALTAYWADQKHIPWSDFPMLKSAGRSYVIWHNEITGLDYKTCPADVVMDETDELIERTKQLMKSYQEADEPAAAPTYKPKSPVPGPTVSQVYGGKVFGRGTGSLTLAEETSPLQYATPTATPTGKPFAKGRKVSVQYYTIGDDGELWVVEAGSAPGNRFPFSAFEEGR